MRWISTPPQMDPACFWNWGRKLAARKATPSSPLSRPPRSGMQEGILHLLTNYSLEVNASLHLKPLNPQQKGAGRRFPPSRRRGPRG